MMHIHALIHAMHICISLQNTSKHEVVLVISGTTHSSLSSLFSATKGQRFGCLAECGEQRGL